MPFACGIATPTIVLPAECDGWSLERRRAVLLHELAHVRRHDLLGHTIGRVACALYWFHPLAWTAARHLRNESERACDDLALSCGTRATDYAEHLLEIVTSVRKDATPSVALAMARRKEFEGRMLAILDPELRHSSPTRRQSAALIGSLALVALTVGAVSPVARTAEAAQAVPEPSISGSDAQQHAAERTVFRADTARREVVRSTITAGTTPSTVERAGADAGRTAGQFAGQFAGRTAGQYAGQYAGAATTAVINNVVQALTEAPKQVIAQAAGLEILARPDVQAAIRGANGSAKAQSRDERVQLLAKVLATDTSASLRRVAAWGLHEYADQQVAVDALATALRKDASTAVREMAAWALGEGSNHNGVATDALSAALKGDADEKVRATSAWALGQAGDRGSVDALVAALSSSSPTVRTRALWAIGTVEPRQAPREVIALLRDPEPRVRHLAAWALYQIEDPATAGPLKDAIAQEQDKDVQLAEIRALGALGEKSVEALKALVESSDPRMRSMAVHALAGGQASGPWPWPWPQPRPFP
jgi:HEAT repeat protein